MKRRLLSVFLIVALCLVGSVYSLSFNDGISVSDSSSAYASETLSKPTIKVKASGYEALKVSWNKVSGAKKYYVYRSTSKNGTYKKIGTTSKTYYNDKKINQNKTYYYKVKAVKGSTVSKYSSKKSGKINTVVKLSTIPEYKGLPYVEVNGDVPKFSKRMITDKSSESYSKLDSLGRCGIAYAVVGKDIMPTEERGSIGMVKPAGWHTVRYDDLVDGKYLYNRCHLIGYQLTGENANEKNLITGTRYMNVDGMLPFENMVADYVEATGNHVMYRVIPVYSGKDLLCKGVQMEAYSVEDKGEGICFNVFVYNVQPGVGIDYSTGESWRSGEKSEQGVIDNSEYSYILNTNTKKFHYSSCSSVGDMRESNKEGSNDSRDTIISLGYKPCGRCNP